MELLGEVTINAGRERVWDALNDAATLQACIPGCEALVDESPDTRRATVMVKIGPVRARFQGRVTLSEAQAPASCLLRFEGSGGAAGMASGSAQVILSEAPAAGVQGAGAVPGSTRLGYSVKASVGGKLGQIGGRMIDASAKQLADQFFMALRAQLEPAAAPAPLADSPASQALDASLGNAAPQPSPRPTPPLAPPGSTSEASRLLWFAMGVAATAFGVWLGARFFH